MAIKIYKNEKDLADLIKSSTSIAYTSAIRNVTLKEEELECLHKMLGAHAKANPNQFDLYYLESVLASLGWNNNDDVFDKEEMWNARSTPVDKPFNFMHNEKDIIGHLTSSKVIDFDGHVIGEDVPVPELPDRFDIVVGSVLYKTWSDPELQDRMNKLIAEIGEGKWCVSMECLFRHFDYAVRWNDNGVEKHKVVARNDETSFLTKHLRIYGGTGQYGDYKVGRLLRNFTFSGKGLVDNPANPRSHITSFNENGETSSFAGVLVTAEELNLSKEEKTMSDVVYTKEQYEALKAELDQIKAVSQQAVEKEIDELTKQNQALSTELEASKEVSNAKDEKVVALEAELTEVKAKLEEAEKSIKDAEVKAINASRKALLLERVDEQKAENLVQKFANASQEMFDALVESLPVKSAKMEDKEEEKDKEDEESCDAEIKTDLDDAKADDNAEMASGGSQEEETLRSKAAAWFSTNVLRSTANKK